MVEIQDNQQPIDVVLADDHAIFRTGMRELLLEQGNIRVVAEVDTGEEAVEQTLQHKPKVVIMDIRMPGKDGIQATREIKAHLPHTLVVVISACDDEDHIFSALEAGANGYVVKDDEPSNMVRAVQEVAPGRLYLGPSLAKRTLQRIMENPETPRLMPADGQTPRRLTEREVEIVRLLAHGKKGRDIACVLGISERTVRNHLTNIFAKLRVRDRTQVILYAVRSGLIRV